MNKFGLIGKLIGYSRSEAYFNKRFKDEGVSSCSYENFELSSLMELRNLIFTETNLVGINVTTPFKEEVLSFCDFIDPTVEAVGAANVISISREENSFSLNAYNTDVLAFEQSLKSFIDSNLVSSALVLGTGGAAKAALFVLRKLNIETRMVSRSAKATTKSYGKIKNLSDVQLIVQATPLGQGLHEGLAPELPYETVGKFQHCFDMNYNPEETEFLRLCKEQGAKTCNGQKMLEMQADLAYRQWQKEGLIPKKKGPTPN